MVRCAHNTTNGLHSAGPLFKALCNRRIFLRAFLVFLLFLVINVTLATEKNVISDLEKSMPFFDYRSALKEGYSLYSKVDDVKSKNIIGCSIKK